MINNVFEFLVASCSSTGLGINEYGTVDLDTDEMDQLRELPIMCHVGIHAIQGINATVILSKQLDTSESVQGPLRKALCRHIMILVNG